MTECLGEGRVLSTGLHWAPLPLFHVCDIHYCVNWDFKQEELEASLIAQ